SFQIPRSRTRFRLRAGCGVTERYAAGRDAKCIGRHLGSGLPCVTLGRNHEPGSGYLGTSHDCEVCVHSGARLQPVLSELSHHRRRERTTANLLSDGARFSAPVADEMSRSDGNRSAQKDVAMKPPVFTDILDAKRVIDRYLQPTPLHHYPGLSAE